MRGARLRGIGMLLLAHAGLNACGSSGVDTGTGEAPDSSATAGRNGGRSSLLPSYLRQALVRRASFRQSGTPLSHLSNPIARWNDYGEVEVVVHGYRSIGSREQAELAALGATVSDVLEPNALPTLPRFGLVQAWVPGDALEDVAGLSWVAAVTAPEYPELDVTSEGVARHRADLAQAHGIDGAGVSVGVISDGVGALAEAQASGDLPHSCPAPAPCVAVLDAGGGDEGTAMLEIVHDMSPGANLFFHTTGGGVIGHLNALNALVRAGVNVIAEDVPFDQEPVFQQGQLALAAEAVAAAGISVHSSAGNLGNRHAPRVVAVGTGGGPDGKTFPSTPSGCDFTPDNVVAVAPGGDTTFDIMGYGGIVSLQWSEPRAIAPTPGRGGFTDLNVYVMDADLTRCLAQSTSVQADGVGDPLELVGVPFTGAPLKIVVDVQGTSSAVGPPRLDMKLRGVVAVDPVERAGSLNPDSNYIGLASSAAAFDATATGFALEAFSAGGPVELGSTTQCPGGVTGPCTGVGGGGAVQAAGPAPTWTAADGVSVTGAGFFPPVFFGTSAAAPHAAACDALARQALGGDATVAAVRARLAATAQDQDPPGSDPAWGFGVLDCFAPASIPIARCRDVSASAGPACAADVAASAVDAGSTSPSGEPLSFSLAPPGPFALGSFPVTLTASDGTFASTCTATVTVTDDTPPSVTPPRDVRVARCVHTVRVNVGKARATDNCAAGLHVAGEVVARNGIPLASPIPVVHGKVTLRRGRYTIRWTASDGTNIGEAFQTVRVGVPVRRPHHPHR